VFNPHSHALNKQSFYAQVRDYDAELEPWLRAEYRNLSDAEEAFHNYQSRRKKPSLFSRIKNALTFDSFKMDVTFSSVHEYLSQSKDRFDLEQRERKIMRGNRWGLA
jgi:hypothetical protein